jgi:hypothetical protein
VATSTGSTQIESRRNGGRLVRRFAIAGLCLSAAIMPMSLRGASAQETPNRDADEAEFVALINELRAKEGAAPLTVHPDLVNVARGWTVKMKADRRISHNPNLRFEVTADWRKLGENVGMGPDVQVLHEAFVQSPNHLKNLVDPTFDQIAVTIEYSDDLFFVTQQFMDTNDKTQATSSEKPKQTTAAAPNELALSKPKAKKSTKKSAKKPAKTSASAKPKN